MLRLTRTQFLPIGLDVGHDSVKLLQLEVAGASLSVHASARHAIPEEARRTPELRRAAAMGLVRQMLRQGGFSGRRVVASVPRELVHIKNLRLPMMPAAELAAAIEFEARNVFTFDTADAQVRYLPAGEVRQGTDVKQELIVLAVRNADIDEYAEEFYHAGAVIESLDFEPCAVYRGVERFIRRREDEGEVNVLVDIGLTRSQVVIGKGRDINFIKPVELGGEQFTEAVSRKLGIATDEARSLRRRLAETPDPASASGGHSPAAPRDPVRQAVQDATRSVMEELGREIALCLRYYSVTFRGQRPAKVRLVGGEAGDPHLGAVLNATLPIPVEPGRPLMSVNTSRMKLPDRRGTGGEWGVAFGLGLKVIGQYFGARDGRPRDPSSPIAGDSMAEVVDLNRAIHASNTARPANGMAARTEAAHA